MRLRLPLPCLLLAACAGGPATLVVDTGDGSTVVGGSTTPYSGDTGDTGAPPAPPPFTWVTAVERHGDTVALRTNLPRSQADCLALTEVGAPCGDADGDTLVDAWEALVLDRLRPAVALDEEEPFVTDPGAVLRMIGRVTPAYDGNVRVRIVIAWSRDYGRCAVTAHDGDSERVALDLAPLPEGPGDVAVARTYTAAHEDTITDHGRVWAGPALAELSFPADPVSGEPRWLVFASDGKHATYGSIDACESAEWAPCLEEDCGADGVDRAAFLRLPPIDDAGEPDAPALGDLSLLGFPGDHAWLDQPFCGGAGGSNCTASIREKLLDDPFPP